jgi:integrase
MPAKRVNGAGSVYQRKDGRWVAAVTLNGRRIERYESTRRAAEARLDDLRMDQRQGTLLPTSDLTLSQWVEQWLDLNGSELRPSTLATYRQTLEMVGSEIGDTRLDRVTPLVITQAFQRLQRAGRGRRRLHLAHTYLKKCLGQAVDLEMLATNPMTRVPKPRWEPRERVYWTLEETRQFIDTGLSSADKWGPMLVFLATTGLRISEALALTWADVDCDARTVRVSKSLVWIGSDYDLLPPKTRAGRRVVSLPQPAMDALRLTPTVATPDDGIFRTAVGRPLRHEQTRDALDAMCREAGVTRINVHGLRHVAAMLALAASGDAYLVQQRLGHSHIGVTLAVYGYSARNESSVAPALDRLLSRGEGACLMLARGDTYRRCRDPPPTGVGN